MSIVLFRSVDFETSKKEGGEPVEAGWTDVWVDTETRRCEIAAPQSRLFGLTGEMDPGAQGTHHITPAQLAGLAPCTEDDLRDLCAGADFLVAHNANYERTFLTSELLGAPPPKGPGPRWVCTMKTARWAWEDAPEYGLQALKYWRGLDLDPGLALPAHRAGPDSYVGACVLAELLKTESAKDLVNWTILPTRYVTCPIGKHKGALWSEIPHGYLRWMTGAEDMEFDLKYAANAEINRRAEQGA